MSAITAELVPEQDVTYGRSPLAHFASDVWVLTKRSIARIRREPETLADVTFMPVIFILMFAYVFGGAIAAAGPRELPRVPDRRDARDGPGPDRARRRRRARHRHVHRADRQVPVAADVALGGAHRAVDRRAAHSGHQRGRGGLRGPGHRLAGAHRRRATWPPRSRWPCCSATPSPGRASAWAWRCAARRRPQQTGFIIFLPLTFVSSAFVPTQGMPGWLQPVAEWNPMSALAAACRHLFGNPNPAAAVHAWPMQHPELAVVCWSRGDAGGVRAVARSTACTRSIT